MPTETAPQSIDTGLVPPRAWRPVIAVATLVAAFLAATCARYGYHRDELYFLQAGRHLAWGYDDQPPLTPLLVRGETALFGSSVESVRLVPMVCSIALVVFAALCAREFGGGSSAQVIAAAATACTPLALFLGHIFVTATVDVVVWSLLLWLLARWLRTRADRLWLWIGVVAGLGLLNNNLVAGLAAVLAVSALIAGPRDVFVNRWVWAAAGITVALWLPYLIWQGSHGWPETKMMSYIAGQRDERVNLLPFQLEAAVLATPIWVAGVWRLARDPGAKTYRMLAWAYPLLLGLLVVSGGKRYYPDGFLPLYFGAGSVPAARWASAPARRWRRIGLWGAIGTTALATAFFVTPVLSAPSYSSAGLLKVNDQNGETIGWPQLAREAAAAYATIPDTERPSSVILAENYGVAGALAHFGPAYHLPFAFAPHDGYRRFGVPDDAHDGPVLVVGYHDDAPPPFLSGCARHGVVDNGIGAKNQEQGWPIWVCSGPHEPWTKLWPTLVHYS